jgi:hypothetical protein
MQNCPEWEASAYPRDSGVRACACGRHIHDKMTVLGPKSLTTPYPHVDLEKLPTEYGGLVAACPAPY